MVLRDPAKPEHVPKERNSKVKRVDQKSNQLKLPLRGTKRAKRRLSRALRAATMMRVLTGLRKAAVDPKKV
jgi:ribosomal protein L32